MVKIRASISNTVCSACQGLKSFHCSHCNLCFESKHNKKYCSKKCLYSATHESRSKGGRNSAEMQSNSRRSLNEIYFAELCKLRYSDVMTNAKIFNGWDADVILPTLKIAVLWNGVWHYNKITKTHSPEQVQNRDKIKIKNIIKEGYTPYVIADLGSHNVKFVETEFKKFSLFAEKLVVCC